MGPCASDFGCSEGSRASLTDAAVWRARPGEDATSINHLAVSPCAWQQTRREDASAHTEGSQRSKKMFGPFQSFVLQNEALQLQTLRGSVILTPTVFIGRLVWASSHNRK